jgi:hypothetical protein
MRRTILRSPLSAAVFCTGLLTLTGCASLLYDDRCGPEGRDVTTVASRLNAAGDTLVWADLQLGETRGDQPSRSLYWYIYGEPVRGHIQEGRLVASEDTSVVLFPLTGGHEEAYIPLTGQSSPYTGTTDFNQLFTRARTGGLTAVLDTDLPSLGLVALPLVNIIQFNDWGRAHCS